MEKMPAPLYILLSVMLLLVIALIALALGLGGYVTITGDFEAVKMVLDITKMVVGWALILFASLLMLMMVALAIALISNIYKRLQKGPKQAEEPKNENS